jgi:hypothetical protein
MPAVLVCPCCGAPYQQNAVYCKYCKVYFSTVSGSSSEPSQTSDTPETPTGWIRHTDTWYGFSLVHPVGWTVNARPGSISIREDPVGISSAVVSYQRLQTPKGVREYMLDYIRLRRQMTPNFTVWEVPAESQTPEHMVVRFGVDYLGYQISGMYDVRIQDQQVFLSGFGCPNDQAQAKIKCYQSILASFNPIQRMERQKHQEPSEGAYTIWAPPGWQVNAGLNRQNINNFATMRVFIQRDPQGLAQTSLPDVKWSFTMGMMPWGGSTSIMPYLPAIQFFQNFLLPQISQQCQDLQVVEIVDRPDFAMGQIFELQKVGMNPNSQMVTAAHMIISYMEKGVRLRQYGHVDCIGFPGGAFPGMWSAYLSSVYRAPENEYAELQPILVGILDSLTINPSWKQAQDSRTQSYLIASHQDQMNRLKQISQTVHETNEMFNQSYQRRQESDDRISHEWSNATLGVQDMADQSGSLYTVPSGYDQYWRDGLDNLYVGDWLTNPDPTWTRLEPVQQ